MTDVMKMREALEYYAKGTYFPHIAVAALQPDQEQNATKARDEEIRQLKVRVDQLTNALVSIGKELVI